VVQAILHLILATSITLMFLLLDVYEVNQSLTSKYFLKKMF
jgi:hypothetical protein